MIDLGVLLSWVGGWVGAAAANARYPLYLLHLDGKRTLNNGGGGQLWVSTLGGSTGWRFSSGDLEARGLTKQALGWVRKMSFADDRILMISGSIFLFFPYLGSSFPGFCWLGDRFGN